jgi:hypothetical protein
MKKYQILKDAGVLVENQLELLAALHEGKKLQIEQRSRIVCRLSLLQGRDQADSCLAGGLSRSGLVSRRSQPHSIAPAIRWPNTVQQARPTVISTKEGAPDRFAD